MSTESEGQPSGQLTASINLTVDAKKFLLAQAEGVVTNVEWAYTGFNSTLDDERAHTALQNAKQAALAIKRFLNAVS